MKTELLTPDEIQQINRQIAEFCGWLQRPERDARGSKKLNH